MKNIKKIAKNLLIRLDLYSLPVDPIKIIENLGIELIYKDLQDSVSGALLLKGNHSIIVVNENHHPNRQKFSISHELSHYLLHKGNADLFVDDNIAFFRDIKSSSGVYKTEVEANQLAAEILMPEELLRGEVNETKIDPHDIDFIEELSEKIGVSSHALTLRLKNLDLFFGF